LASSKDTRGTCDTEAGVGIDTGVAGRLSITHVNPAKTSNIPPPINIHGNGFLRFSTIEDSFRQKLLGSLAIILPLNTMIPLLIELEGTHSGMITYPPYYSG
jgi:hypothetical protein